MNQRQTQPPYRGNISAAGVIICLVAAFYAFIVFYGNSTPQQLTNMLLLLIVVELVGLAVVMYGIRH
jgi:hypothetical protein